MPKINLQSVQNALKGDREYAYAWKANISVNVYDAIKAKKSEKGSDLTNSELNEAINEGAHNFLVLLCDGAEVVSTMPTTTPKEP